MTNETRLKRLEATLQELLRKLYLEEEWAICKGCHTEVDKSKCDLCAGLGSVVFLEDADPDDWPGGRI